MILLKNELKLKIENFLKNQKKKELMRENIQIIQKIEFKLMKEIHESENFEEMRKNDIESFIEFYQKFLDELNIIINNIKFINSIQNIQYYSFRLFKNIHHKLSNMRIFYHILENNNYNLYLSFNLNDKSFKNEKIENISKIELIKILNKYSLNEKKLRENLKNSKINLEKIS